MSEIRDLINQLIAAGVDPAEAAEVVARAAIAGAANAPKVRSAGAIRQERYRRNKASHVTESDAGDGLSSPEGSSPTPPSPKPHQSIPPSPPKGGSSPTPRSELQAVLDDDHADAVIQHRQKMRKPLTAHAAKLLAGKFSKCNDANAAADAMIANGWQGFEVEWLESRGAARPTGPPPRQESDFARHQRECTEALERKVYGDRRNDQFASNGAAFDLEPGDGRPH